MDILIEIAFILTGVLIAYLFYLREKIIVRMRELKGDKKIYQGVIFLPVKFNLHDEYSDKVLLNSPDCMVSG